MALLSQVDWIILLGVAAFILLGRGNAQFLRQLGRWYAKATRLKQELLSEFRVAADLPANSSSNASSIRSTLFDWDLRDPSTALRPPEISAVTARSVGVSAALPNSSWTVARPIDGRTPGADR